MSLALLREVVRDQVQNAAHNSDRTLRELSRTERQAVRAMRRQARAAASSNRKQSTTTSTAPAWWL
jgi:hypothetical protein